jgi:hypothetical protein
MGWFVELSAKCRDILSESGPCSHPVGSLNLFDRYVERLRPEKKKPVTRPSLRVLTTVKKPLEVKLNSVDPDSRQTRIAASGTRHCYNRVLQRIRTK